MVSERTASNIINASRKYSKYTRRNKNISLKIGKEGKYYISTVTHISINVITGTISTSVGIKYLGNTFYYHRFGKRNYKDPKYLSKLETKRKNDYTKNIYHYSEYNKNYYIKNKERITQQRTVKRNNREELRK